MLRWGLFVFGLFLIVTGLALPLWATFAVHHFSDEEITPFSVEPDLSGKEVRIEFTALHTGWYDLLVTMALPPGTPKSDDGYSQSEQRYCCLLRSPHASLIPDTDPLTKLGLKMDCRATPGRLEAFWTFADVNGTQQKPDYDFDNVITSVLNNRPIAQRKLDQLNTEVGHRYVLTARVKSDDPTIRRLKPHLTATIATTGISESIALTRLITYVAWGLGFFLLLIGIPLAIAKRPRMRSS